MAGVNKVLLIGRVGKVPEIRTLEGGKKVANLSLATSETFKDREGNRQERTEWHRLSIWGAQAEVAEKYLMKGSLIYAEGKIRTREYEQDGVKKYSTEIMVDSFTMLGSRNEGGQQNNQAPASGSTDYSASGNNPEPDDLPF